MSVSANMPIARFVASFAVIAMLGFAIEVLPWVDQQIITPLIHAIAWVSGGLITTFGGAAKVIGNVLMHPSSGFAVAIANGCSGLETVILFVAAVCAFPAPWRYKLAGMGLGTLAIMALNLLRVISLYYLGQYSAALFQWAHLYAWDILIILDGAIMFLLWLRNMPAPMKPALP